MMTTFHALEGVWRRKANTSEKIFPGTSGFWKGDGGYSNQGRGADNFVSVAVSKMLVVAAAWGCIRARLPR